VAFLYDGAAVGRRQIDALAHDVCSARIASQAYSRFTIAKTTTPAAMTATRPAAGVDNVTVLSPELGVG
jgi:hypothetical protein